MTWVVSGTKIGAWRSFLEHRVVAIGRAGEILDHQHAHVSSSVRGCTGTGEVARLCHAAKDFPQAA